MYKYSMEIESNVKKLLLDTKELQDKMDTLEGKEYKINLNIDEKKLGNVISNLEKMLDSLGKGTGDFKQFENLSKELSSIVSEVQSLSKAFGKVDDSGTKTLLSSIQNIDKSLSELSQNILNVNKNMSNMGGDTSGAVKQVENISDAYQNAAKEAVKLADAQSKIGQKTNISLGDSKEQSTEIDLYHNLEKRKVTYDEIIDKIQTIISLKEKEKSLSKTSDDTKLYQKLYDENDINWAGDTEGTINRISDRLKEIYIKYNGKISLINENDIQEAAYLLDILKGAGESPNLNKSQEKFYQNKKFSNDSLFDNIHVDSQKTGEIDKINTELSETYRWFNQLEGVSLNENIANEIKSLISDMQIGGKNANEYANDLLKIFNIEVGSNSVVEQQNKLQSELKETESQAEKTTMAVKEVSSTASTEQKKDAFPDKDISASVESATNSIKEENNVLEQNTQKVKENTQAKEQNANVNFNKYDKRLDSYNGKIDKYKTTIDRFNDGGWTSNTYLENVQAVKDAVNEYETLLNELKGKDASLVTSDDISKLDEYEKKIKDTIATVTNMSAAEKGYNFVSGQKELDKIHKLLNENSKMSSEAKAKIRAYYTEIESGNPSMSLDRIHGEIMKIYNAEVEAGRAGRSFFDTLKNSGFHQLAAQMSGMFGFYDVINLIKQAASAVTELNTQITELAKVSEDSVSQIYADFDSYANIAKEMGSTISDTIAATTAWSKDGYNIPDSKELAEVSLLYKNVGDGINIDEANESLVSTLKGFKLEADQAEHIVDVFNEVSNREPISSSGIGEALQRSAASFNAANTSLEKSVALVTATNSVLQDPEKVGNMWKTVSARIRGAKTELEEAGEDTDGMVESTSKLQALIKGMTGFDIMESDGKTFKDIYDIIIGIGKKWQDLNDVDRASLLEKLAGKNQSNALAAALSQVDLLKKAYGEATNAEGSAREENSKYQQSVQYSIDQTKAKLEELANDTLNSKFLKGLINAGGKIIDILDIIIKNVGILKPLIAGLAIKNIVKNFD
nr:MAG TPA: minor tail protein [Caudoviricetes sp.]